MNNGLVWGSTEISIAVVFVFITLLLTAWRLSEKTLGEVWDGIKLIFACILLSIIALFFKDEDLEEDEKPEEAGGLRQIVKKPEKSLSEKAQDDISLIEALWAFILCVAAGLFLTAIMQEKDMIPLGFFGGVIAFFYQLLKYRNKPTEEIAE